MARRYEMRERSAAVEATRARVVGAAVELFSVQGVQRTRWEEIAELADVSTATVYRHFPTAEQLVPACARAVFDVTSPPTVEQAGHIYAGIDGVDQRLRHLIDTSVHCYEQSSDWLEAVRRERHVVGAMADISRLQDESLDALIRAAFAPRRPTKSTVAVLKTLIDFPFWKELVDHGLTHRGARAVIVDTVNDQLNREVQP